MRGAIVIILLSILAGIIAGSFVALWVKAISSDEIKTLLTLVFTPIVGLVGAATGFYYGGRPDQPSGPGH
jgi:uncharacterized protein YneF (UPF0154 family)